jgi:cysteine-rich repeat protein
MRLGLFVLGLLAVSASAYPTALEPRFNCVSDLGSNTCRYYFGYLNPENETFAFNLTSPNEVYYNFMFPTPADEGQTQVFSALTEEIGAFSFTRDCNATDPTWTLTIDNEFSNVTLYNEQAASSQAQTCNNNFCSTCHAGSIGTPSIGLDNCIRFRFGTDWDPTCQPKYIFTYLADVLLPYYSVSQCVVSTVLETTQPCSAVIAPRADHTLLRLEWNQSCSDPINDGALVCVPQKYAAIDYLNVAPDELYYFQNGYDTAANQSCEACALGGSVLRPAVEFFGNSSYVACCSNGTCLNVTFFDCVNTYDGYAFDGNCFDFPQSCYGYVPPTTGALPTTGTTGTSGTTGTTGVPSVCGNGILEPGEQCDDGNLVNTDGCNVFAGCIKESACCYTCDMGSTNKSWCYSSIFPDGEVTCTSNANNFCQLNGGDLIISTVLYTPNGTCDTACPGPSCGDGNLDAGEQCDDLNQWPYDNCSTTCEFQPSYACCFACLNSTTNETVSTLCENNVVPYCNDANFACPFGTYFAGAQSVEGVVCNNSALDTCPSPLIVTTGTTGTTGTSGSTGSTAALPTTGSTGVELTTGSTAALPTTGSTGALVTTGTTGSTTGSTGSTTGTTGSTTGTTTTGSTSAVPASAESESESTPPKNFVVSIILIAVMLVLCGVIVGVSGSLLMEKYDRQSKNN